MKQRRIEWSLIGVLLLICVIAGVYFYLPKSGEAIAVITVDGKEYRRIPLARAADETFSVIATADSPAKPVSFEIRDHQIRFIQVTCPDHLCEQAGWCARPGNRAVCMPNRVALVCYAPDEL